MITKVGMLIIIEPDVEQAVEFYTKLGFEQKFHMPQKWAEFQLGDIKFGLCPADVKGDRHTGIVLEVDDMNATAEQLKKENVNFIKEPFEAVHGIMASIKDPGGNIIDLYHPTPEKLKEFIKQQKAESAAQEKDSCCSSEGKSDDSCCK